MYLITFRQFDYNLFFSVGYLVILQMYLEDYYHPVRTHQGLNCQTPILSEKPPETKVEDTKLVSKPILGGLYHSYKKVA